MNLSPKIAKFSVDVLLKVIEAERISLPTVNNEVKGGKSLVLRKDKIINWWMNGGIGLLYILWVNFRVADGSSPETSHFALTIYVGVGHLLEYSCTDSPLGLAYLCTIRWVVPPWRAWHSYSYFFQCTGPYLSTYCNTQVRRHFENLQRLTSRWSAQQRTHDAQPKAFSAQPKAYG